jgi:HAD superfamily hydrolase (TIGR01450 family)
VNATPDRWFAAYVFDMDGTVYLGGRLLPGAGAALAALRRRARVVFLTNKPLQPPAHYAQELTAMGVLTRPDEVMSSTDALVLYLERHAPGARLFVIGEPPLLALLHDAGHELTEEPGRIDVLVVSFDRTFDYRKLQIAFDAVRAGARIVATNPDPYCPVPGGGLPDCAAMLAAVEACTGARAEAIVGKPSAHMAAVVLDKLGLPAAEVLMCGDRLATDVRMANEAGMASALTLTGATAMCDVAGSTDQPQYIVRGLAELLPQPALIDQ